MMPSFVASTLFYVLGVMLLAMALMVVTSKNVFYCAMGLSGSATVSAGLFALLGADFLAVSQLLVYVGGVMVILLFVVMLSQGSPGQTVGGTNPQWPLGLLVAGVVTGYVMVLYRQLYSAAGPVGNRSPTTIPIGRLLMNQMLVPFEAVSLVLLAALVGAVVFGQNADRSPS